MRAWALLLGGLILWAAHFFALYIVASVFHTTLTARILTLVLTLICLIGCALLLSRLRSDKETGDPFSSWMNAIAMLGALGGAIAILWQALPAVLI